MFSEKAFLYYFVMKTFSYIAFNLTMYQQMLGS